MIGRHAYRPTVRMVPATPEDQVQSQGREGQATDKRSQRRLDQREYNPNRRHTLPRQDYGILPLPVKSDETKSSRVRSLRLPCRTIRQPPLEQERFDLRLARPQLTEAFEIREIGLKIRPLGGQ